MTYEFKTKPYTHQKQALKEARGREAFAYLMEMGTGKTKVAVDEIGISYLDGLLDAVLVVAPKGVYANWTNIEIPTHMPDDLVRSAAIYLWDGMGTKRSQNLAERCMTHKGLSILVMNTEAFSSSKKAIDFATKYLKSRRAAIFIDESTLIKNHSSARTKALVRLSPLAKFRRIMTGSPVTRSPLDFFAQFQFLKAGLLGTSNWFAFRSRYAILEQKVFGGRSVLTVSGYQNLPDLTERVRKHSFRVLKEECLDLPPKVFIRREVPYRRTSQSLRTNA
jgi:SNF2 family DNA or RNA helicase